MALHTLKWLEVFRSTSHNSIQYYSFVSKHLNSYKHYYLTLNLSNISMYSPVSWGCWIRRLHLCKSVRSLLNDGSGYETKWLDGEAPVLEIWKMWSTSSLPLLPDQPWPGLLVQFSVLSMGQRKLVSCI